MKTELILEGGKVYENAQGRLIQIVRGCPPLNGERVGWNGIYWGDSVDGKEPKIESERYTFKGKWWSYISQFSQTGYRELSNPTLDLIKLHENT